MRSRSPYVIPGVQRFPLDLPQAVKSYKECALKEGLGGAVVRS